MDRPLILWIALLGFLLPSLGRAAQIQVATREELKASLLAAKPGDRIVVAPGTYRGGYELRGVNGTAQAPIVIEGVESSDPPVLEGGNTAFQLEGCNFVTLRNFVIRGAADNGVRAFEGERGAPAVRGLRFEELRFEDIGPEGNHDGLKISGVDDFAIRRCTFKGWGGSAIDMVGCHDGVVEDCRFLYKKGARQANCVQIKGGSRDVLVQTSFFIGAAERAINLGGSTGLQFFRPLDADYEAKDITIAGNRFVGFDAPIAWVTAIGGRVHHNTFYLPQRWVGRIAQETEDPRFSPCRNGVFENNLVVAEARAEVFFRVGKDTAPETFVVRGNAWYVLGGASNISLGLVEEDGVYGIDPKLAGAGTPEMAVTSTDERLVGVGAGAYRQAVPRGKGKQSW